MLNIQENVALAPLTTFKIGGPARYFVVVSDKEELIEALKWAKESPPAGGLSVFVLGGGSNILFSDKGFDGLVIKIQDTRYKIQGEKISSQAGVPLAKLVAESIKNSLTGLEWGIGIPGTIGGAAANNAGAFGKDISKILEKMKVLEIANLEEKEFLNQDCGFKYRQSMFKGSSSHIILSVVLNLERGNIEESRQMLKQYLKQRSYKQSGRSAGCFFKNVDWNKKDINKEELIKKFPELKKHQSMPKLGAGFIIDQLGLKGKSINDATVSYEHASYIVNRGKATAEDVIKLSGLIKEKVKNHYGIFLEEEVEIVH